MQLLHEILGFYFISRDNLIFDCVSGPMSCYATVNEFRHRHRKWKITAEAVMIGTHVLGQRGSQLHLDTGSSVIKGPRDLIQQLHQVKATQLDRFQ